MALSVPLHTTRDRTLPNPAELLPNGIDPRRSSSLLQHHISSLSTDKFANPNTPSSARRSSVADVIRPENEGGITDVYMRQRQDSIMSGESPTESSSDDTSPTEGSSGYCLCVPDPKIPRPRNGELYDNSFDFSLLCWCDPSFYFVPSKPTCRCRESTPWPSKSGHIQDHRWTMEASFSWGERQMESVCRSKSQRIQTLTMSLWLTYWIARESSSLTTVSRLSLSTKEKCKVSIHRR